MPYTGIYNTSGQVLVKAVSGASYTGLYNDEGSFNGVLTTEDTSYKGRYHPCGAIWIKAGTTKGTATDGTTYATLSSGSIYTIN